MNQSSPIVGVIRASDFTQQELAELARSVIAPGAQRKPGKSIERWNSYLAGRAATALLLKHIGREALVKVNAPYGFLTLTEPKGGAPKLFVNISHTHEIAVAVIAGTPVGIDVERHDRDPSKALRRAATEEEVSRLTASCLADGGSLPSPITLWSAKEASAKAVGLGMKFGLQHFQPRLEGKMPYPVTIGVKGPQQLSEPALRLIRLHEWVISVCTEASSLIMPLVVHDFRSS